MLSHSPNWLGGWETPRPLQALGNTQRSKSPSQNKMKWSPGPHPRTMTHISFLWPQAEMRNCLNQRTQTWKEFSLHHPAYFLPTPCSSRALAGLFISKVIITSLEKLFRGLKDLTVRKSSHVSELDALLIFSFSYNFIICLLLLLSNSEARWHRRCLQKVFQFCRERNPLHSKELRGQQPTWKREINTWSEWSVCRACVSYKTICLLMYYLNLWMSLYGRRWVKKKGMGRLRGKRPPWCRSEHNFRKQFYNKAQYLAVYVLQLLLISIPVSFLQFLWDIGRAWEKRNHLLFQVINQASSQDSSEFEEKDC